MVCEAAKFTTYLLTPTRRSRRQVTLLTSREPLRIRSCTIAAHFVYVYVLLIRKLRPTYLYTYTFIVSATTIAPITAIIIITLIHRPALFIIIVLLYLPSYLQSVYIYCTLFMYTTSGVRPEVRCSAEAGPLYTYIYTYTNYVY